MGYAALMLHDSEIDVTADRLNDILKAAKIEALPVYATLYEKFLQKNSIESMLTSTAGAAQAGGAPAAATSSEGDAKKEDKKAAPVVEEEEDEDMGLGLFD
eukprot:CAMPEP_0201488922 /NCGR_PEP_ID=MMETSP0151_2-20130828/20383_1 /ASSEMBLY_ACC=CAM_ASM_000257 /TAXON_ID=200890 /ORGANISM="Paramoeba atlantica, Strain 621/1 / CCAP 1560/9" /LENGTH=100 /DNA_ID=CAMNT_0047874347 /DNA_START=89 /DNA_END=391 /DNA_ORIENTATION=+